MIHYDTLLLNAADIITKCDSYFIARCDKSLLQNVSDFLLQNATVLLQNTTILLQNAGIITKSDVYYKFRQYDVLKIDVRPVRMKFRVQLMKSKVQLKSATNEI